MTIMKAAVVSGTAQTLHPPSAVAASIALRDEKPADATKVREDVKKEVTPAAVDTISLSALSQKAITADKKKTLLKEETNKPNHSSTSGNASPKVQFVYDQKGTLIVKYMDTANRLVYQVPSELNLMQAESASKSDTSVDMKA
jgi:hypothetical protein